MASPTEGFGCYALMVSRASCSSRGFLSSASFGLTLTRSRGRDTGDQLGLPGERAYQYHLICSVVGSFHSLKS